MKRITGSVCGWTGAWLAVLAALWAVCRGQEEDESSPPPREVDEAKHSNVGRTVYWGCVNRTYHITGDRESVPESAHDDQSGASNTGLKIYVGCVIENYHVTTDRTT
uniref:Secreted protein n=1 Tax=Branchiostoma floridae TaxID=7739 RepID=C3YEN3_BRAFL|eukprot:XP_002605117.1 hypothetical protein BRAFLDRAFT_84210 [Branchiostoma floridae]